MRKKILLDVGCGEATDAIALAEQGFSVVGVEKKESIFKIAKENIKKAKQEKNVSILNKDVRDIELNMKFDKIIFCYVLMFMPQKDAYNLLEKYYKKLRPKGEIIVKMLMSDDKVAKNMIEKRKEEVFFPTKEELKLLAKKFYTEPDFKFIQDDPHGMMKYEHTHSVGYFTAKKSDC